METVLHSASGPVWQHAPVWGGVWGGRAWCLARAPGPPVDSCCLRPVPARRAGALVLCVSLVLAAGQGGPAAAGAGKGTRRGLGEVARPSACSWARGFNSGCDR